MLSGQTILIVEAQFLIALDIQRVLEDFGAAQTVFTRNTPEAIDAASRWPGLALALVEVHADNQDDIVLLEGLQQAGVRLVLMASDVALRRGNAGFPASPMLIKPFTEEDLASAIRQALA